MDIFKQMNRYQPCCGYRAVELIDEILKEQDMPLTEQQKTALRRDFDNCGTYGNLGMPFHIYLWKEEHKVGASAWWRLTVPFLFLCGIIVNWIGGMFRWLMTGKSSLNPKGNTYKFFDKWYTKVMC